MRLKIKHITDYHYSSTVFLEPHYLYLYPSIRPNIELINYEITVSPTPSGLSVRQDAESNFYHQCWFNDMLDHIKIEMNMEVKVNHFNPFDFLIETNLKKDFAEPLKLYLRLNNPLSDEMAVWSKNLLTVAGDNKLTYLSCLCAEIYNDWEHVIRYEDNLLPPENCFNSKSGSCRDLSWMMIQIIRQANIPARFVSGYANNPELVEGHELHAWLEAWVDGPGWIGIDPSSGLFTNEQYIPLAASYDPGNTFPVQGSYRGTANSTLTTSVDISEY